MTVQYDSGMEIIQTAVVDAVEIVAQEFASGQGWPTAAIQAVVLADDGVVAAVIG
jgi:hypothetical protein